MAIRRAGDRVLVIGSAAAPVGGDALVMDVVVGAGSRLVMGSVAATMAWPGPHGDWSSQAVTASIGDGGHLTWTPEPLVAVTGCRHRSATTVTLGVGASACIVEEVALGRTGEPPGRLDLEWRVERGDGVLVHHAERFGPDLPGWHSAVTTGRHRHVIAALEVGGAVDVPPWTHVAPDGSAARLPLAADAFVVLVVAPDRPRALALLTAARDGSEVRSPGTADRRTGQAPVTHPLA